MSTLALDDYQLEMLPANNWDEGMTLSARDGSRLERWGSSKDALKILGYKKRESLYLLIKSGEIRARKLNPKSKNKNSPYRVDLLSCWDFKQTAIAEACL